MEEILKTLKRVFIKKTSNRFYICENTNWGI